MFNNNVSDFNIADAVESYGINNIRIFGPATPFDLKIPFMGIGFKSSDAEPILAEFMVQQIDGTYKVHLRAIREEIFGTERSYQSDFNYKVNSGVYGVYVLTPDGYMPVCVNVKDVVVSKQESKLIKWFSNLCVLDQFRLIGKPFLRK